MQSLTHIDGANEVKGKYAKMSDDKFMNMLERLRPVDIDEAKERAIGARIINISERDMRERAQRLLMKLREN